MSFSPHKVRFGEKLREARVRAGQETYVSKSSLRPELEEKYRAGFEAGQKALGEELMRQRAQLVEIQNGILRSMEKALPTLAVQLEKDLIAVALEAARRVVQGAPLSVEAVEAAVRSGIAELQDTAEYQVRLHPEDLTLLQTVQSTVLPSGSNTRVGFVADGTLPRGGCLIHTQHGAIEVNREKMFERLKEAALC